MMIIDFILFGFLGLTIWAVQMMWIPFLAAGVINGVGHYWGYRTFQVEDASRNIVPWGILIGGEELHNNHHAYPTSARLSHRWWEFDIGWLYIRTLEVLGLAHVKKVVPRVRLASSARPCDEEMLRGIILTRYDVLSEYARSVKFTCVKEIARLRTQSVNINWQVFRSWLRGNEAKLLAAERDHLNDGLRKSNTLCELYALRAGLPQLWQRSNLTKEQLVRHLETWCARAEISGIVSLRQFSNRLRRYRVVAT